MRIIAGESRGRKLKSVRRGNTRPTMDRVRESLLAILMPWIRGARFLDLFAGTGSVGLEALSRGASFAAFIDSNRGCVSAIHENLELLQRKEDAVVLARPWAQGLSRLAAAGEPFDIIFADPPYEQEQVLFPVAEKVEELNLLKPEGWLIFQHSVRLSLPDTLGHAFHRTDTRRFGETVLTFYRSGSDT